MANLTVNKFIVDGHEIEVEDPDARAAANNAQTTADQGVSAASKAQTAADNAQTTANKGVSDAAAAKTAADNAQTTADQAKAASSINATSIKQIMDTGRLNVLYSDDTKTITINTKKE